MDNIEASISENTKAILLLTTYFNSSDMRQFKPLTINGYGYFARWLNTYSYQPSDLLNKDKLSDILNRWQISDQHIVVKQKVNLNKIDQTISDITPQRIQSLLGRGASLSMALEKWSAVGIWVLDRGHSLYPIQIKRALKDQAPAVIFGIGNIELLSKPSIGFVGSRDADQLDLEATENYVKVINQLDFQVVSGAARGIDSSSMLASLKNGGTSVGVIADSLLKASVNSQWREYLKSKQLTLITPFYPESRFTPSNAMQRNKYIYLLSQATVVICSSESNINKKSGTFEGAKENLKNDWVPLFVSEHRQPNHSGNIMLLNGLPKLNAKAEPLSFNCDSETFRNLNETSQSVVAKNTQSAPNHTQVDLFDNPVVSSSCDVKAKKILEQPQTIGFETNPSNAIIERDESIDLILDFAKAPSMPLFNNFYQQLKSLFEQQTNNTDLECININVIENHFPEFQIIGKTALDKWLKYLVDRGLLIRPNKRKKEFCLPGSND